jgi:homoserine kinase type II
VATVEQVRGMLRAVWHVTADECAADVDAGGSMPGSRWYVTIAKAPYVVWLVPESHRPGLLASLQAAEALALAGITVDAPVHTADGALTAMTGIGEMTLCTQVTGRPLDGHDPIDQQWWGDLLGRAHAALRRHQPVSSKRLALPVVTATHLGIADWLRPVIAEVVLAVTRLTVTDQLSYGVLHGDPGPGMFRIDTTTGRTALTRWGSADGVGGTGGHPLIGPLVYDVAVAVRYAGGLADADELIDGYVSAGPVARDELATALPTMLRLHWALIADQHARALASTGSMVPLPRAAALLAAARRDALEEARKVLAELANVERAD